MHISVKRCIWHFLCWLQGVAVDEDRIKTINMLADRLIKQGRTDINMIKNKKDGLNEK